MYPPSSHFAKSTATNGHSDGNRTVAIERGGNQFGVTHRDGVIVDRSTVYDPDDRRSHDERDERVPLPH